MKFAVLALVMGLSANAVKLDQKSKYTDYTIYDSYTTENAYPYVAHGDYYKDLSWSVPAVEVPTWP
tara:strand:- start:400 stop:597 length:198 start_codon:yes stop_codon:yes gene_type:complete